MRRVTVWLAIAAALLVTSAGCDRNVQVDAADDGSSVVLGVGEVLVVDLGSNPSTGYSWQATGIPEFLEQDGEPEYVSGGSPAMVGAPGQETWRFTAAEVGSGTLVLEYRRPWEEMDSATDAFELEVTVE